VSLFVLDLEFEKKK